MSEILLSRSHSTSIDDRSDVDNFVRVEAAQLDKTLDIPKSYRLVDFICSLITRNSKMIRNIIN